MREIKFRAWDAERKAMLTTDDAPGWVWDCVSGIEHAPVMQFTGLQDKSGKEIYEGDVILADKNGLVYFVEWSRNRNGWAFDDHRRTPDDFVGSGIGENELEVIGNIYENPELLETN